MFIAKLFPMKTGNPPSQGLETQLLGVRGESENVALLCVAVAMNKKMRHGHGRENGIVSMSVLDSVFMVLE